MRLGWGRRTIFLLVPRTQAARALRAGAHSTLHGVVFAILCLGSAVYRRRGAALRPGHEIVGASRSRRIDPTPMHHALASRQPEIELRQPAWQILDARHQHGVAASENANR